jgi:hypothetical protein
MLARYAARSGPVGAAAAPVRRCESRRSGVIRNAALSERKSKVASMSITALAPQQAQRTIPVLEQVLSPNPIPAVPELEPALQTAGVPELEPAEHPMRVVPAATGSRRGNWACQQL